MDLRRPDPDDLDARPDPDGPDRPPTADGPAAGPPAAIPAPRTKGPVLLRREQISGSTTDQRLLDTRDSGDWVHTDPWRVLRIQAEFVEGFGTLAELGPAISVFGSARTPEDHPEYALAERTARAARRGRLRGHHRRRPGHHGGGQPRGLRGRRDVGRPRASSCRSSRA